MIDNIIMKFVITLLVSPALSKSFVEDKLRNLQGSEVKAFDMPGNVGDLASNLPPDMVAQTHEQAANYLPAEAHQAINGQLPENL